MTALPTSLTSIKRLLIYRLGQIGDTVAALPALWHLRAQLPNAHLTMLSEIPQNGEGVVPETVIPSAGLVDAFQKYKSLPGWRGRASAMLTAARLRVQRFDAVAYLAPTIRQPQHRKRDELFFKLAGIRTRLGFNGFPPDSYPREANGLPAKVMHEADALLARLAADGFPSVPEGHGRMDLALTTEEKQRASAWIATADLHKPWAAICAGSKWSSKRWPEERFAELGKRLLRELGITPVIVGGPEDRQQGDALIRQWGAGHNAAGQLSVRESAALMSHAMLYVGNDTGVMHLAAAEGVPCVGLFSALDWPGRWAPYGSGHISLRADVPCAGCLLSDCPRQNQCMEDITLQQAWDACRCLVSEHH